MVLKKNNKGIALMTAIVVLVSILGISIALLSLSVADNRESIVNRELNMATDMAEGATEIAHKQLLVAVANYQDVPTGGVASINGHDIRYAINPVGVQRVEHDVYGVQTIIQPYSIASNATSNGLTRHVEKIIDVDKTPIFQYVVFYNGDLEILPGPNMTLNGRVHSNHDVYIGSGATLTLQTNYAKAAGHFYRERKDDGTASTGTVRIQVGTLTGTYKNMDSKAQFTPPSKDGFDSQFLGYDANKDGDYVDTGDYQNWTLRALALWQGTVQSAEHGVKQVETPSVGTIAMYTPIPGGTGGDYTYNPGTGKYDPVAPGTGDYDRGYFYNQAGLSIIDNKVYQADGTEITSWPDVNKDGKADNPISEKTFYNGREKKNVTTTCVDLGILGKSGYWPANGLVYAARTDGTSSQPNGIRLNNGGVLSQGLTVVSPDPVYVKGNYNTGDVNNPKKPAAIISDSVNILSNAWNDTKKSGTLPKATETTVNAAFIGGSCPTTPGKYSGGFENFPRFHENWDSVACHIRGSFVDIWDSQIGKGQWVYGGDQYTAPTRDWNYDSDFNDFTKLPPFTPEVVTTTRVVWVSR